MKVFHIFLIILSASLYNAADEISCGSKEPKATKASDCHSRKVSKEGNKCCYVNYKYYQNGDVEEGQICKEEKKVNVDNFIPAYKSKKGNIIAAGGSIDKFDVDCSSNYLYISLLSLMILLL